MESAAPLVVAVLAGGRGTRIDGGKAIVDLHGQPLVNYPLQAARDAGLEAVVVAKRNTRLPPLDTAVLVEPDTPVHPLCGVIAALQRSPAVLAVGCDMPFLTGPLLARFAGVEADAVAALVAGRLQPFPAVYRRTHLHGLSDAMDSGRSLRQVLGSLRPHVLSEAEVRAFGDPRRLFLSVNDRDDLARAESWIEGAPRPPGSS